MNEDAASSDHCSSVTPDACGRPDCPPRLRIALLSALVFIVVAVLLFAMSPMLPMAWDEGAMISRSEGIDHWVRRWFEREAGPGPLADDAIQRDWQYTRHIEGHPALPGIVIALGRAASSWAFGPLTANRAGPMLLFALACGAMFYRVARQWSPATGLAAVAALVLLPRMFAHVHFAGLDGPVTSCWLLAWAAFAPACRARLAAVLWGVLLGLTLAAKFTGWLAPAAFVGWAVVCRDRGAFRALAIGAPVALVTFWALNPPLWHHPLAGAMAFFRMNLGRAGAPELNVAIQFLGEMYDLHHTLPWYNTLFWTAITVPVGLLALLLVSLAGCWRDRAAGLVLCNAAVSLVVRALPGVPPHDGIRLFLPAFAFLAILAGLGARQVVRWFGRPGVMGVVLLYCGSATSLFWYAPQWLSYYNLLIGGLRGATAAGMEPTYYWDALGQDVFDWLEQNTPAGEKVCFAVPSWDNLEYQQRWGMLRRPYDDETPGRYRWYVIQRRPGAWIDADQWLLEHGHPAFQKTIRAGGWGPWRLDVPLVDVFRYEEYLSAGERKR